jgi:hypothetical protein
MNNCLTGLELKELGDSMIVAFDKRIASIPNDLCAPFHQEARQLETELLTVYRVVALGVRKEQDLNVVAAAWDAMVKMCDAFGKSLHELTTKHPYCGAESYYNSVLDLRNKCNRLQKMHS